MQGVEQHIKNTKNDCVVFVNICDLMCELLFYIKKCYFEKNIFNSLPSLFWSIV